MNLPILICLTLLIYSYFVFSQDTSEYNLLFKIFDIMNLTVTDTYSNVENKSIYGQSTKAWFANHIFYHCKDILRGSYVDLYDGLEHCLPAPFCKTKGSFYNYVRNVL